ncbi:hypothetical protein ELY15_13600 [Legionella sp. km772]|nr:hypothetical protein ELY15_13600 [Legionella sp. km772]
MPNKYPQKKGWNVPKQKYKLTNWSDYKGSRYLVKDSGTSESPKSTRQRAKLKALAVLRPLMFALNEQSICLPQ